MPPFYSLRNALTCSNFTLSIIRQEAVSPRARAPRPQLILAMWAVGTAGSSEPSGAFRQFRATNSLRNEDFYTENMNIGVLHAKVVVLRKMDR